MLLHYGAPAGEDVEREGHDDGGGDGEEGRDDVPITKRLVCSVMAKKAAMAYQ